jgi:hypothetical protein
MKKAIASLLGLATLGVGITGIVSPKFLSKVMGVKAPEASHFLLRAIGVRDVAFGLGILAHRNKPREAAFWVYSIGAVVASDGVGRLPGVKSEGVRAEVYQAAGVATACFITGFLLSSSVIEKEENPAQVGGK